MSMFRVFSCVVGRGCLLWPAHYLDKTLLAFALLHFILQGQICLLLQVYLDFLTSYFCTPVPCGEKDIFFLVLVLEGLLGLHRTGHVQLWHQWLGHRLGLLWCWMVCLGNKQKSFCHFEIAPKNCISDCCWLWGYSISAKGFLPTVVDIIVVWIKFALSSPF